ncbi:hypothetical protein GGX14DRAFT_644954 [Mycena pura]|uniref:F-box domain-containing protein n=1 Tax=Mycena pura TaxID=153505 RepID=A0AAD6V837_9AGAR|nr:hypothetical protein GGX14DRAFT_644954 [Mycena pura]
MRARTNGRYVEGDAGRTAARARESERLRPVGCRAQVAIEISTVTNKDQQGRKSVGGKGLARAESDGEEDCRDGEGVCRQGRRGGVRVKESGRVQILNNPYVASPSLSMGQYWNLLNLDKRETHGLGKLGEGLQFMALGAVLDPLWRTLEFPDCDSIVRRYGPGELLLPKTKNHGAIYFAKTAPCSPDAITLLNLPVEIIHEIYECIDEFEHLFSLSITCQVLWEIGRGKLYRRAMSYAASYCWAGDRIVVKGDDLQKDDIPETLSILAWERREIFVAEHKEREELSDDEDEEEQEYYIHSRKDLCKYNPPSPPSLCILRNLSQRQYVREAALLDLQDNYKGTHMHAEMDRIALGEVVLCRTCLSSSATFALRYEGDIHRGVWAGDRFDIVSAKWLKELKKGNVAGDWTDVSNEALKEVEDIWVALYDSD